MMKRTFVQNVLFIMSGAAISQALKIASAPVLTRLYDPSDFGIYSLYVSVVAIIVPISALRYDLAIVLPKDDKDAVCFLYICSIIIFIFTILAALCVFFFGPFFTHMLGVPSLNKWLWWSPISIFSLGIFQILFYWSTRKQSFKRISLSKVLQSFSMVGTQIFGGIVKPGVFGLIVGQILGHIVASTTLLRQVLKVDKIVVNHMPSRLRIRQNIIKYQKFPLYSTPQTLINQISQNLLSFVLVFFFGPAIVGFYMLTNQCLSLPISLLSGSVRHVFYSRICEQFNEGKNLLPLVTKAVRGLLWIGIGPGLILTAFGAQIFSFVLGDPWAKSGLYCQLMAPWLLIVFIKAPTLTLIDVFALQQLNLVYEIVSLALRLAVVVVAGKYHSDIGAVAGFSVVGFMANFWFLLFILNYTKKHDCSRLSAIEERQVF